MSNNVNNSSESSLSVYNDVDKFSAENVTSQTDQKGAPRVRARLIRTVRPNLQKYGDALLSLGDSLEKWADDVKREAEENSKIRREEFDREYQLKSKALDEQAKKLTGCSDAKSAWDKIQGQIEFDRQLFK